MAGSDGRWHGDPSEFPWEREALDWIKGRMPDREPYRAWANIEFVGGHGHVREVDLLIAVPGGLYLIEVKSQPGRLVNSGETWTFRGDQVRSIGNPLFLTNQKAKELRSLLERHKDKVGLERVPFVEAAVFLSARDLKCELDDVQRQHVYGRDGVKSGLPGLWEGLLERGVRDERQRINARTSMKLQQLLSKAGVHGIRRRPLQVGPFELARKPLEQGPTWTDFLATNKGMPDDHRRVRVYLVAENASKEQRESVARAAKREYLALGGIDHPGIIRAEQHSVELPTGSAVVFRHDPAWLRLDQYMAQHGAGLDESTRLDMVRQLAEALDHAHRRHLYHRALAARSVWVEADADGRHPRLRIADWQVASRTGLAVSVLQQSPVPGLIAAHVEAAAAPYLAPEAARPDADAPTLDIFGLGAITYLILTGQPPAFDRNALLRQLAATECLVPSATGGAVTPEMDDLVGAATRREVCDRTASVREFLDGLDAVEEALTAPETVEPVQALDLLEARANDVVEGWRIERILGKGSTARAFEAAVVDRDHPGTRFVPKNVTKNLVLKVALDDAAADRLLAEAEILGLLRGDQVVRMYGDPVQIGGRLALILDRAGDTTMAEEVRRFGRLSLGDLEHFGRELFRAMAYLERKGVRHRDLKPDNMGIETQPNGSRVLVLFDFSLASVKDNQLGAGTPHYLDPFLGSGRRSRYDDQAERYAVAVTLHEMASGKLPTWGDGQSAPEVLPPAEQVPQLAEELFDPALRDGLTAFFHRALHRETAQRFASLKEMQAAWEQVFSALDQERPLTTPSTGPEQADDAQQARDEAAERATLGDSLTALLSPRAASAAADLGLHTVRDLVRHRADELRRVPGVDPRNELLRRAAQLRRRLGVAESDTVMGDGASDAVAEVGEAEAGGIALDGIVRKLVPQLQQKNTAQVQATRLLLGLPDIDGLPCAVSAWATQQQVTAAMPHSADEVAKLLKASRDRWHKLALKALRDEIVEVLAELGRVAEADEVALRLLARHGSLLQDNEQRLALARAAVRAAVEVEDRREGKRFVARRNRADKPYGEVDGLRVLLALVEGEQLTELDKDDLFDYAERLGREADALVDDGQLPSTPTVLRRLRAVEPPPGVPVLPDTRLIGLAAAVSARAAANNRAELYARTMTAVRALQLAQVGMYLAPRVKRQGGEERAISWRNIRAGVLARFPLVAMPDSRADMRQALRDAGFPVEMVPGTDLLVLPPPKENHSTDRSRSRGTVLPTPVEEQRARLAEALRRGGPLAVTVWDTEYVRLAAEFAEVSAVSAVNVAQEFVALLRAVVAEQGRPPWEAVIAADSPDAPVNARAGFARLQAEVWRRMETRIRAAATGHGVDGPRVVLLYDATPIARYDSGHEFLARMLHAARQPDEAPHGLWLLCPMGNPHRPPRVDGYQLPLQAENVRVALDRDFTLRQELTNHQVDDGLALTDRQESGRAS